ncbi:uncharacterized protein F4822DRAFT_432937 [Hypoxylon trugodes]|uniref:uncharacterized protein n=1 Tax=Hypoxylon trugodes TaxID=326681 RepID=UPI0021938C31|nr:uncharacterized protein F4822DRAFT_432937 [Hypoxylon trugodes]KAI1384391.1 hypothetical protein F4822DRAFT_432937 [Hypoxylon trugodes]
MSSNSTMEAIPFVTLMCELCGIEQRGEAASTLPPLAIEQVATAGNVIQNGESAQSAQDPTDHRAFQDTVRPSASQDGSVTPSHQPYQADPCPDCGKANFKTPKTRQRHMEEVHVGTRCHWPGCNVVTPTEGDMNRHLKVHNMEETIGDEIRCNWVGCNNPRRKTTESVYRHLRKHQVEARNAAMQV